MRQRLPAFACALVIAPQLAAAAAETDIHLGETATKSVAPDRLRATLRLDEKGRTPREVQAALNRGMEAALAKAKSVAGVTLSTGFYNAYRTSSSDPNPWEASESLILTSGDFPALLGLAGDLQNSGLEIAGLEFYLAPETVKAAEAALTAAALAALKARAEGVASDMGLSVAGFTHVDVGNASPYGPRPIPMPMAMQAVRGGAAMPPPAATAGESTISLTVSADVALEPKKP
jgi:predicted secreted protein